MLIIFELILIGETGNYTSYKSFVAPKEEMNDKLFDFATLL